MLLTKTVMVKWTNANKKYYIEKGYIFTKRYDEFEVKIEDLTEGSGKIITLLCDYCKETIIKRPYGDYIKGKKENYNSKDCCINCSIAKCHESMLEIYGVKNTIEIPGIKEKIGDANRKDFDSIKKLFRDKNLIVVSNEYRNARETKIEFICEKHPEEGIQSATYGSFLNSIWTCKKCAFEKIGENNRKDLSYVKNLFNDNNLDLLTDDYKNYKADMPFRCRKHPNKIQYTSVSKLEKAKFICRECIRENYSGNFKYNWLGNGELYNYLRRNIKQWKKDSVKFYNYKCIITGEKFDDIHHLYGFNNIIFETVEELNLPIYERMSFYNKEEINLLVNKCLELHDKYGFGVPLTRIVHKKFHLIYGKGNNTPEQFEEFKQLYFSLPDSEKESFLISK